MPVRHLSSTQSTGHRRYKKQQQWLSTATNLVLDNHNFLPESVTHTQKWQHYASWNTSYVDCPALPPFLSSAAPSDGNVTPPSSLEVPQTWDLGNLHQQCPSLPTTVQWFTTSKSLSKDHNCREPFRLWCCMPPFSSTWLSSSHPERQY